MKPRLLKKLSKKAEPIIINLGLVKGQSRVVVTDGWEGVESNFIHDYNVKQCKGTVGYGAMSGYYEPEWEDSDCYSILFSYVMDHFFDWGKCDGTNYPECEWPSNVPRNPHYIFRVAKFLAVKYATQAGKMPRFRNTPKPSSLISVLK